MKQIQVFRYEYETDKASWRASIAAFSAEEAMNHLYKSVKGIIKVNSSSHTGGVDAFSDEVRKELLKVFTPEKKPVGRPPVKKPAPKKVASKKPAPKKE